MHAKGLTAVLFFLRRPAALLLIALLPALTGACAARGMPPGGMPHAAPKPPGTFSPPQAATEADLSLQVAQLAVGQQVGSGQAHAVVIGNVALVALPDVNKGMGRGPINSPPDLAGRPGSETHKGLTTQGRTPSSTPGTPGNAGSPTGGGMANTGGPPGQAGTAFDMMTRISDHIRSRLPQIVEVRFLTRDDEAARLRAIAMEVAMRRPVTRFAGELAALLDASVEAGTVHMPGGPPVSGSNPGPGAPTGARTGSPPATP